MATADQVNELRRATNTPVGDAVYTDQFLGVLIDAKSGLVNAAAAVIWREKAATYAAAVDTNESGSSRKLSDLHKNALGMADQYEALMVRTTSGSGSIEIERV